MVLKSMQLLLETIANLVLVFVAALDGFELAADTDEFTA